MRHILLGFSQLESRPVSTSKRQVLSGATARNQLLISAVNLKLCAANFALISFSSQSID